MRIPFSDHLIDVDRRERVIRACTKYLQNEFLVPSKLGFPMRVNQLDRRRPDSHDTEPFRLSPKGFLPRVPFPFDEDDPAVKLFSVIIMLESILQLAKKLFKADVLIKKYILPHRATNGFLNR